MTETQILAASGSIIIALLGVLLCVIGWLGSRVINRLDDLVDRVDEVKGDLHNRINGIETRLVKVETITIMGRD
jgi:hypothetical protein